MAFTDILRSSRKHIHGVTRRFFLGLVAVLLPLIVYAQSIEYSVKASFIEKFARFTDWSALPSDDYFVIDVLGESPFNGELETIAKKIKIKNRTVKINYIDNYQDIKNCQLLFISASEKNRISAIMKFIEHQNILAIADTPGFCKKGVHLNFYIDESETVKYEVNPAALKRSNLTVEMQLLSYGKIVQEK
ncbi:MAG: YfiR family protein [Candidatus Kapaibacterium sp.]